MKKSWKQHPAKQELCGDLPLISKTIRIRRTRYAEEVGMNSSRSPLDPFS